MNNVYLAMKGVFLLGIFSFLFGASKGEDDERYVTEKSFKENLVRQVRMAPETVAQLRGHGVSEDKALRLEVFFYTDSSAKAMSLVEDLAARSYDVHAGESAGDEELQLVTGWTIPIKMDEQSVVAWTEEMVRVGYTRDCEFDGWGTNPNQ